MYRFEQHIFKKISEGTTLRSPYYPRLHPSYSHYKISHASLLIGVNILSGLWEDGVTCVSKVGLLLTRSSWLLVLSQPFSLCLFHSWLSRVVLDKGPLNGCSGSGSGGSFFSIFGMSDAYSLPVNSASISYIWYFFAEKLLESWAKANWFIFPSYHKLWIIEGLAWDYRLRSAVHISICILRTQSHKQFGLNAECKSFTCILFASCKVHWFPSMFWRCWWDVGSSIQPVKSCTVLFPKHEMKKN